MDITTRLKAIEARAKALGWGFNRDGNLYEISVVHVDDSPGPLIYISPFDDEDMKFAERLLSLYEDGPVDSEEISCYDCRTEGHYCMVPGPGKYKLVKVSE